MYLVTLALTVFGPYFTKWEGKFMIRREFGTRDKEGTEERKERLFY
jgi:hypothetical protein